MQTENKNANTQPIVISHKDKIYPWIKVILSDDDLQNEPASLQLTKDDSPIMNNWLGDLVIFYVADMDNRFHVLLERDMLKDMSKDELHNLAVNNLSRDIQFKVRETNFGGYGLIAGGDHEAAAICIPGIWDWLTNHLNDNLIVCIPSKDLIMMVPERDMDKISNVKIFVHQIFKTGDRLLTRNIFKYDRDTKEWTVSDRVP